MNFGKLVLWLQGAVDHLLKCLFLPGVEGDALAEVILPELSYLALQQSYDYKVCQGHGTIYSKDWCKHGI